MPNSPRKSSPMLAQSQQSTMIYGHTEEEFRDKLTKIMNHKIDREFWVSDGNVDKTMTTAASGHGRCKLILGVCFGILAKDAKSLVEKPMAQVQRASHRRFKEALDAQYNSKMKKTKRGKLVDFLTATAAYCSIKGEVSYTTCLIHLLLYCILDTKGDCPPAPKNYGALAKKCGVQDDDRIADVPEWRSHKPEDNDFKERKEQFRKDVLAVILEDLLPFPGNEEIIKDAICRVQRLRRLETLLEKKNQPELLKCLRDRYSLCPSKQLNQVDRDFFIKILSQEMTDIPKEDPESESVTLPIFNLGAEADANEVRARVNELSTRAATQYLTPPPDPQTLSSRAQVLATLQPVKEWAEQLKESYQKAALQQSLNLFLHLLDKASDDELQSATEAMGSMTIDAPDQQDKQLATTGTEQTAPTAPVTDYTICSTASASNQRGADVDYGSKVDGRPRFSNDGVAYCFRNAGNGKWEDCLEVLGELALEKDYREAEEDELELVGGRYCLDDFCFVDYLGGGTFGHVFLVHPKGMSVLMALKVVAFAPNDAKLIQREVTLASAVKSDHIVMMGAYFPVPDLELSDKKPYTMAMVVEACPSTLDDYIKRNVKNKTEPENFPERLKKAIGMTCQLLAGVLALQGETTENETGDDWNQTTEDNKETTEDDDTSQTTERNKETTEDEDTTTENDNNTRIIHRDLKPKNICIAPNGLCTIIDFGVARTLRWNTEEKDMTKDVGTISYTPPGEASTTHDEYSCGVILYELITGELPFSGDAQKMAGFQKDSFYSQSKSNPVKVRKLMGKECRDQLLTVFSGLLAPENHERMAAKKAHDMLCRIGKALESKGIENAVEENAVEEIEVDC